MSWTGRRTRRGRCRTDGIRPDFHCGDEVYGNCTELREHFEAAEQAYTPRGRQHFRITLPSGGGTVLRPDDSGKPALPARAPQETGGARERGSAPPHPGIAPLVRKHPRTSEPALHRRFGPERQLLTTTRLIPRRRAARHVWLDVGPAH
ncbi:hypothetical protein GCM10010174_45520 [Kutzneria viridogrisea]